jgi:ADP-ribosylglycohydrolase
MDIYEGFSPRGFAKKIYNWCKHGFSELGDVAGMGLGQLTARVISRSNFLVDPIKASYETYKELGGDRAPNGSLMRCGIAAMSDEWATISILQSKVTHVDVRCIWCAFIITYICRMYLLGKKPSMKFIESTMDYLDNHRAEVEKYMNIDNLEDLKLDDEHRGYVLKTFMCGIYTWRCIESGIADFKTIMCKIANEGGDVDTNCAVAGQILGAYLGTSGLPQDWIIQLKHKDWLDKKIKHFRSTHEKN